MGLDQFGEPLLEGYARPLLRGKGRRRGQQLPLETEQCAADGQGQNGEASGHASRQVEPK